MNIAQLIGRLERELKVLGTSRRLAAKMDVTHSHMSDVLKGTRAPGPSLLRSMGLERVVMYRKVRGGQKEGGNGK
jgi:hypothetical protein